jgi:hypothetical protein
LIGMRTLIWLSALLISACGSSGLRVVDAAADGAAPVSDAATTGPDGSPTPDAAFPGDASPASDASIFAPGGPDPVAHGAPTPIAVRVAAGLDGVTVNDVAVDTAGGLWASTDRFVVHVPPGGAPRRYDAHDGLALGDTTVPFRGVGAGGPGQAFIGTAGKWADVVDVRTDGSLAVHHLTITNPIHAAHVTIAYRFVVDLGSAYGGTVWIGAEHGHSTVHGIATGYCWGMDGCFEEHRHSDPGGGPAGDVKGLAVCPDHQLWTGDAWWVGRMRWGGAGTTPDFWRVGADGYPDPLIDGFPGVDDNISAIACDDLGGLWVASYGNGLLHLDPATFTPQYFDAADSLSQNVLTAVLVDADGSVWIGTGWAGITRYQPQTGRLVYYNALAGLRANEITALAADFTQTPRTIYIGSVGGLSAYSGP